MNKTSCRTFLLSTDHRINFNKLPSAYIYSWTYFTDDDFNISSEALWSEYI